MLGGTRRGNGRYLAIALGLIVFSASLVTYFYFLKPVDQAQPDSLTADQGGGTLNAINGKIKVVFPAGALSEKTVFTVSQPTEYTRSSGILEGSIYSFGPSMNFSKPAVLTINYDPAKLPNTSKEDNLKIAVSKKLGQIDYWLVLENSTVDKSKKTVSVSINSFSDYSVTWEDNPLVSDYYQDLLANPPVALSGFVKILPASRVVCKPAQQILIMAQYTDGMGKLIPYMGSPYPSFFWRLKGPLGSMYDVRENLNVVEEGVWLPSVGVISLFVNPNAQPSATATLEVMVEVGYKIVAKAVTTVEISSNAIIEPESPECAPGEPVSLECLSPYNEIGEMASLTRYEWSTTGSYGALLDDYRQPMAVVYTKSKSIVYRADVNAMEDGFDQVGVKVFKNDVLVTSAQCRVTIAKKIDFALEPYPNNFIKPGQRTLFSVSGEITVPLNQRYFDWKCTSKFGQLEYPDPSEAEVWYRGNTDAPDGSSDTITVDLYMDKEGVKTFVATASSITDTYNPTTSYGICSAEGKPAPFGSGAIWELWLIDHEPVTPNFKARVGDRIRIKCVHKGGDMGDLYIGKLFVMNEPLREIHPLVAASQCFDGWETIYIIK